MLVQFYQTADEGELRFLWRQLDRVWFLAGKQFGKTEVRPEMGNGGAPLAMHDSMRRNQYQALGTKLHGVLANSHAMPSLGVVIQLPNRRKNGLKIPAHASWKITPLVQD